MLKQRGKTQVQVPLAKPSQHLVRAFEGPLASIWGEHLGTAGGSWLGCRLLMLELRLLLLLLELRLLLGLRLLLLLLLLNLRLLHRLLQLCWGSHGGCVLLLRLWNRRGVLLLRWPHLLCGQVLHQVLLGRLRLL